jgi:hypothetical protein
MKQYEYRVVGVTWDWNMRTLHLDPDLDQLGMQGWELIQVAAIATPTVAGEWQHAAIFKREKMTESEDERTA